METADVSPIPELLLCGTRVRQACRPLRNDKTQNSLFREEPRRFSWTGPGAELAKKYSSVEKFKYQVGSGNQELTKKGGKTTNCSNGHESGKGLLNTDDIVLEMPKGAWPTD